LGFLNAAHKGEYALAVQYLNTRLRGQDAYQLVRQLFVVLDRRLPAKLQQISDRPEGSLPDPMKPDQDLVGTVVSSSGPVDILVERVKRGVSPPVWLFSRQTLDAIPGLYEEVAALSVDTLLPRFLVDTRVGGIALFEWLAVLVGLPLIYLATVLINRLLRPLAFRLLRHLLKMPDLPTSALLPVPARLLILALIIFWAISHVSLTLMARQFWSVIATLLTIVASVWLAILCNGAAEAYVRCRLARRDRMARASVLRLGRRAVDLLFIFVGLLIGLRYFGLNPTAALAGLGVGGVAVALAAQKTLENVIGGVSIIFDKVLQVGGFVKVVDTQGTATVGTVEEIGLRSTRIRTLDRTVLSIPNGQIANVSLENISARDKFWFHHTFGLRYDTTASQMRAVLDGLNGMLTQHALIDRASARVRFLQFGTSSLQLEAFAYIVARDFVDFLEVQSELLLRLMEIVQAAGTEIALQTPVLSSSVASAIQKEGSRPSPEMRAPERSQAGGMSASKSA
jgi:MscS family membrane protein